MAKYIDVESLVVAYSGHTPDDEFSKGVYFVLSLLDSKPPADVRPVVRGRWKDKRVGQWGMVYATCSACEKRITLAKLHRNFCPHCGADMREQEEKPKKDPFEGWSEELKETYRKLLTSLHLEGGDAE